MKTVILDTNLIVRLLMGDDAKLHEIAKEVIAGAEQGKYRLYLDELIVAETVWVLSSNYDLPKQKIASALNYLLIQPWTINPRKNLILETVNLYGNENLSYVDCWILYLSKAKKFTLQILDKKLQKQV